MKARSILTIGISIAGVWLLFGLLPMALFSSESGRGTFGDMFGAVNALFSGLALAGVVCAILLQREELSLQRAELELTRQELSRSAEAQTSSAQTLIEQQKLAKKNIRLAAYTALLQSKNDRVNAERMRVSTAAAPFDKQRGGHNIAKLQGELKELEKKVEDLVQDE